MADCNLPIEIATTHPLTFRWRQVVDTAVGQRTIEHEGILPLSAESAVANLIMIARQQALELERLREQKRDMVLPPTAPAPAKKGK